MTLPLGQSAVVINKIGLQGRWRVLEFLAAKRCELNKGLPAIPVPFDPADQLIAL